MIDYDDIGLGGKPTLFTRLVHRIVPGAPAEANDEGKSGVSGTPILDPRENDDVTVERRLTCGHGDWHEVTASLSSVWCNKCWDMVKVEFRTLEGEPIEP